MSKICCYSFPININLISVIPDIFIIWLAVGGFDHSKLQITPPLKFANVLVYVTYATHVTIKMQQLT